MPSDDKTKKREWQKSFMRLIRPQLFLLMINFIIFGMIFLFTHMSVNLFLYGVLLTLFFWGISLMIQWTHYYKRLQKAEIIDRNRMDVFDEAIIENEALGEIYRGKYQELAKSFYDYRQEEAEKSREQMDYFTLWLHQIKTPIAAISLLLQRQGEVIESQKKIEQELIRLEDYTHMALNYLKLEDTGKELDLEYIQVDEIIKKTLKKYAILFIYNDIKLEYKELQLAVLSDSKWLQVLIEQLLSNSLKYTKKGIIRIYKYEDSIVIEDTGTGIRKEDLPRIFEKGYTGFNGRLHEKSTGLGLFLSRKICERLGHQLTIDSIENQGTNARIDFYREEFNSFD